MIMTKCNECIFLKEEKCLKTKDIFKTDKGIYTKGYCFLKRDDIWKSAVYEKDIDEKIYKENKSITIICDLSQFTSIDSIITNIDNIINKNINEYIFNTNKKDLAPKIFNLLNFKNGVDHWSINIDLNDHSQDSIFGELSTKIKSDNIIFVKDIENINIKDFVNNNMKYLCVIDKYGNYMCNKHVFYELNCNIKLPFLEKIKTIEEWEKECLLINQ